MSTQLPAHVRKVAAIMQRPPTNLREDIIQRAVSIASTALDPEKAAEAATRVAMAFDAARVAAKNPGDFDSCSTESKAQCVADCMVTGLMPGGPMADAWLIPRGGNLTFMPSHRGLQKLAHNAGFHMVATPVHINDTLKVERGEVVQHEADPRRYPRSLDDMMGVIVRVRDLATGNVLGDFWCPYDVIDTRRTAKDHRGRKMAGNVWDSWPVEMALKTAMKWAFARGYVPAQSDAVTSVMAAESRSAELARVDVSPQRQRLTATATASAAFALDPVEPAPAPEQPGEATVIDGTAAEHAAEAADGDEWGS